MTLEDYVETKRRLGWDRGEANKAWPVAEHIMLWANAAKKVLGERDEARAALLNMGMLHHLACERTRALRLALEEIKDSKGILSADELRAIATEALGP